MQILEALSFTHKLSPNVIVNESEIELWNLKLKNGTYFAGGESRSVRRCVLLLSIHPI